MAALSFTTSVVAVATFDGCVCQEERHCSLMKAMPAINHLLKVCVCVCVCKCLEVKERGFSEWMK